MAQTFEFFDQQCKSALIAAEQADLANVRDRERRSAKAWREIADRQFMIDGERVKTEENRAARRAAELALEIARRP